MILSDKKDIQVKNCIYLCIKSSLSCYSKFNITKLFLVFIINIIDNLWNYFKSLKDIIFYNF